jgi:hypothetical protein
MAEVADLKEIDFVNPYLSPLRQWVCTQLANLLPDTTVKIASVKEKKLLFTDWTGYTQADLVDKWVNKEHFTKDPAPKPGYSREAKYAAAGVTTSCEAFINKLVQKIKKAGFKNGVPLKKRDPLDSFNLPGCASYGWEPAKTVGWHWYRDRTESLKPQAGDFFQVGVPVKPGQWSFRHVGVITLFVDDGQPVWDTVEAGQGGPASGYDWIARKGLRPVTPVDPKHTSKVVMGWLNIEEHFEGWDSSNGS